MIHWELCKKFKFDYTNEWYMHNPESVLANETYKLLLDFEIQMDHLISARRPDLVIAYNNNNKKKRTCLLEEFVISADHLVKLKENEKKDQYIDLGR